MCIGWSFIDGLLILVTAAGESNGQAPSVDGGGRDGKLLGTLRRARGGRVLTVSQALFEHVKSKPDMSVDDMLWWLYDTYKIVVGTRTIRRVFERKGDKVKPGKSKPKPRKSAANDEDDDDDDEDDDEDDDMEETQIEPSPAQNGQYQSPYAPMTTQPGSQDLENQLRQLMQQQHPQQAQQQQHPYPALMDLTTGDLPDDEETIQLQLQQIALQKREVELKLKMRRLQGGKATPGSSRKGTMATPQSGPSSLYNPHAVVGPTPPKRDSRSKKKIEESKRRTAERQERMLRDLERRSRRRDHLTAEWVQSKDIWPLRAQGMLADLMHQYGCYTYTQQVEGTFEAMYRELYQLVDLSKGDWDPNVHDEMLRERMKRKMSQLRTKMQKTGEIVGRADGYGGFQKAENYTGEQAGAAVGDDSEIVHDPALQAEMQAQAGAPDMGHGEHLQYDPVPPDQQMQHPMQYPMMDYQAPGQYPQPPQPHNMMPYQMAGQQGMGHQDNLVM